MESVLSKTIKVGAEIHAPQQRTHTATKRGNPAPMPPSRDMSDLETLQAVTGLGFFADDIEHEVY